MAPRFAWPGRAGVLPGAGTRRASVLALVLAAHALLLTLRLPQRAAPRGPPSSAPIGVRLLAPPVDTRPPPALPTHRPSAGPGRPALLPAAPRPEPMRDTRQAGPGLPAAESGTAAAGPAPPGRAPFLLPVPGLPSPAPVPTLAERARARAGERPPETPLQRGIARSVRPDCRQAYSGLVLLAIPALVRDSLRDDGCRW